MSVDKMSVDKMSVDKMSVDKMSVDKMSVDKMSVDKISVDEMSVGEMSVDKLTSCQFLFIYFRFSQQPGILGYELINEPGVYYFYSLKNKLECLFPGETFKTRLINSRQEGLHYLIYYKILK
jgi:hypothetical protein